ncbi:MAG TPA: YraN family protein [Caulobacteraceae bacterium]|jgi:putative endonuclease
MKRGWRVGLGRASRKAGRGAEAWAALWLMLKGYQVLGFRLKTRQGEIDLLARRGRVLAVVEVKRRATVEAALAALEDTQRRRLVAAARAVASRRAGLKALDVRLDLMAMAPGRFPVHVRGLIVESVGSSEA